MSQRNSGYERRERDLYETPEWVTEALLPHLPPERVGLAWEPACASGKMVRVLEQAFPTMASDIVPLGPYHKRDFLFGSKRGELFDAVITNPPYEQAEEFICAGLNLTAPVRGLVAMLLRTDYDHAKSRAGLFDNPPFSKKVVLRKRIKWFDGGSSPSFNHAWFIWDHQHKGPATLAYAP